MFEMIWIYLLIGLIFVAISFVSEGPRVLPIAILLVPVVLFLSKMYVKYRLRTTYLGVGFWILMLLALVRTEGFFDENQMPNGSRNLSMLFVWFISFLIMLSVTWNLGWNR